MSNSESSFPDEVTSAIQAFEKYLDDHKWGAIKPSDEPIYTMTYQSDNGTIDCKAIIFTENKQFLFSAYPDFNIPKDSIYSVTELITRINNDLIIGSFALDFDEGVLRFKDSYDFEDFNLEEGHFHTIISIVIQTLEMHIPVIKDVIENNSNPRDALQKIEE